MSHKFEEFFLTKDYLLKLLLILKFYINRNADFNSNRKYYIYINQYFNNLFKIKLTLSQYHKYIEICNLY